MVGEIILEAYDAVGRRVFQPSKKRYWWFAPTFPLGRYLSQPLSVQCSSLADIRAFLKQCRYVPDQVQFNKRDYWLPPEEFERRRQGDCEDFAFWTWRQLLSLGYDARFVGGEMGRYSGGHAWVTFTENGQTFLVEPQAAQISDTLPRLTTVRYKPEVSVKWNGEHVEYYVHEPRVYDPSLWEVAPLLGEWLVFWIKRESRVLARRMMSYHQRLVHFLTVFGK